MFNRWVTSEVWRRPSPIQELSSPEIWAIEATLLLDACAEYPLLERKIKRLICKSNTVNSSITLKLIINEIITATGITIFINDVLKIDLIKWKKCLYFIRLFKRLERLTPSKVKVLFL